MERNEKRAGLTRRSTLRAMAAGLAGGVAAVALPGAASAHGWRRHWRDDRYDRRRRRRDREYRRAEARRYFFCGPCQHRFYEREAFYGHLHQRHHVPLWRIPYVLVLAAFGWAFYG